VDQFNHFVTKKKSVLVQFKTCGRAGGTQECTASWLQLELVRGPRAHAQFAEMIKGNLCTVLLAIDDHGTKRLSKCIFLEILVNKKFQVVPRAV
jgi:hypothetical protein